MCQYVSIYLEIFCSYGWISHTSIKYICSLNSDNSQLHIQKYYSCSVPLLLQVQVSGILRGGVTLFKSALEPCRLAFRTAMEEEYVAIFKHGDDLRQDQLIIQVAGHELSSLSHPSGLCVELHRRLHDLGGADLISEP